MSLLKRMRTACTSLTSVRHASWRAIPGFSRQEVSSNADIRNKMSNRMLFINYDRFRSYNQIATVMLVRDDLHRCRFAVHRLVLSTFCPIEHESKSKSLAINTTCTSVCASHIDGDKYNNKLSNLEWRTRSEISTQVHRMGKYNIKKEVKLTMLENDKLIREVKCESIGACTMIMNKFLDTNIGTVNIRRKNTYHIPGSSKTCVVNYIEPCNFKVKDIDANEKWKEFCSGKRKQHYLISNYGRVKTKSRVTGRESLKKQYCLAGYCKVGIAIDGKTSQYRVHYLVATLFVPNPNNYNCIDHIDKCNE